MKKLLPILAMLLVLVMVFPVQAEENMEYLNRNIQFVKEFLDGRHYSYRREGANDDIFVLEFEIEGTYPLVTLYLSAYDDGVQCESVIDVTAEGQPLMELCRYMTMVNSYQRDTTFYVDAHGGLWSRNFCFSNAGKLDEDNFAYCYSRALNSLTEFSQSFYDILTNGTTVVELIGR